MKINLSLFILTLSIFTGSFVSADLNTLVTSYGVQSNVINMEDLNEALNLLGTYGSYENDAKARAISAILRAQFSSNTTQDDLGNSEAFRNIFPFYTNGFADLFKKLVAGSTSQEDRIATITAIIDTRNHHWYNMAIIHDEGNTAAEGAVYGRSLMDLPNIDAFRSNVHLD